MKNRRLYFIAILGTIICFIGDNLLGHYIPASDFGNKLICINFSYEWANVNPILFVISGICGIVALLMMFAGFYGLYLQIKEKNQVLAKVLLFSAFIFVSVGILYHNVFSISAYIYNKLSVYKIDNAKEITLDFFNTFILVSSLAVIGYIGIVISMFISVVRGYIFSRKWMCIINPLFFMIICIGLSKILPQTALVNGVFNLGQQSIGLFITFAILFLLERKSYMHEKKTRLK